MSIEIIAELAQGFEGRPELSRLLMKAAAAGGADAVKYQLVYADELATSDYKHYGLFRALEMPDSVWEDLAKYARELGIRLYVDVFGTKSLQLAERLGITTVKLHGTDISNVGFLEVVARSGLPRVLLGAGGAFAGELERAAEILRSKELIVLLGFQGYPTPTDSNQIARVATVVQRLSKQPNVIVGFADHAEPDTPLRFALASTAVGAGARVVEKHLTLGRNMKLEDHESALNPDEFAEFCTIVRACASAFGAVGAADDFAMSDSEQGYRKMIRRHVVASRALTAGTVLSPADVGLKRTSSDQIITDPESVYGKKLKKALAANAPLTPGDVS